MNDRRLVPANDRVALSSLRGQVAAERFVDGTPRQVMRPVLDLLRTPDGPRDRQLAFGAAVTVIEDRTGWAFVQAVRDGYAGYVQARALDEADLPTHHVAAPATHVYESPDMKSPDRLALPFGARLRVTNERHRFFETPLGFVPKPHLWPLDKVFSDPVTVAQLHFGTPYLWGGNTIWGIDCSGLVQAGMLACGIACPGDSDLQEHALGQSLAADATLRRGDVIFWPGHVGLMVDADTLIHANAHAMAVAYEPLAAATARIAARGDGTITMRRRLS